MRCFNCFDVRPTYCFLHFLHVDYVGGCAGVGLSDRVCCRYQWAGGTFAGFGCSFGSMLRSVRELLVVSIMLVMCLCRHD